MTAATLKPPRRNKAAKHFGMSKKIWGALAGALLAFAVKNSWEFVQYQMWIKQQILLITQQQVVFQAELDERKQVRDRELDATNHRIDLLIEAISHERQR